MRIGEINQDNYKQMLSLFGVKDTSTLDRIIKNGDGDISHEEQVDKAIARLIKTGYVEEGMITKDGENLNWRKTVPVSDDVKDKIIATARRQFLENGNGMSKPGGVDGDEFGAIMKEYRKNIPPAERLAVTWTLSQIQTNELQRLVDYVKLKDPTWKQGQQFDKSILTDSNFGTVSKDGVDVKA